ncbi:MAG: triose-phosphate isomerase [Clostridia bacterium]|nr:triose-phosphate isomerase [Clostridia bacterium]
MSRRILAAGNWKMNKTPSEATALINELKEKVSNAKNEVLVCPPFVCIPDVCRVAAGTNISVGAQNLYYEDKGAYTGEVSAQMLLDLGVKYVIIGHSERREYFNETNDIVNKKVIQAIKNNLIPVICVGETLEQREDGVTFDFIRTQVKIALRSVCAQDAANLVIAYEPIWAIGTGKVATSEQANEVCADIRRCIAGIYDENTAQSIRILYGGSVNKDCAAELFAMSDIDGGLVGGASLKAEDFSIIADA